MAQHLEKLWKVIKRDWWLVATEENRLNHEQGERLGVFEDDPEEEDLLRTQMSDTVREAITGGIVLDTEEMKKAFHFKDNTNISRRYWNAYEMIYRRIEDPEKQARYIADMRERINRQDRENVKQGGRSLIAMQRARGIGSRGGEDSKDVN